MWGDFVKGHALTRWNYLIMSAMLYFYGTILLFIILFLMYPVRDFLSTGPESNNRIVNLFEIIYFVANTVVAVVAVFALVFAREQFREARLQNRHAADTRTISVYTELIATWNDPATVNSRDKINAILSPNGAPRGAVERKIKSDANHLRDILGPVEIHRELMIAAPR